jgi:nucleoid-associated protein EbfC
MSGPGGMDLNKMMQQVQQMQAEMARVQEELATQTVESSAGGGAVKVTANGAGEIEKIEIAPEAIDPDDAELLADMIVGAVNEALRSANELAQSRLGGLAGGMGLPGL